MKPALTKFVCALLGSFAILTPITRADADFPELLPVGHFAATAGSAPASPVGAYCSIFQTWTGMSDGKRRQELHEWISDPWGLNEALSLEEERHWEFRLRSLGEKMRDTFGAAEDPLQTLWQDMRAKSDPTGKYRIRQVVKQSTLYSKAKIDMPDGVPGADPFPQRNWRAEESMRISLPVWEPAFVFGQFSSNADSFQYRELNAVAKSGFGVRWLPTPKSEVLVRGGPMVSYLDTNTSRLQQKNHFAVEVLATVPLWGPFALEYTGGAFAASVPTDQNLINQDFRIAMPLSNNSEFYFGAKQQFDSTYAQADWNERRQLYIGIELKR